MGDGTLKINRAAVGNTVRHSLRLKQRKESLPVRRVFADLFRQM